LIINRKIVSQPEKFFFPEVKDLGNWFKTCTFSRKAIPVRVRVRVRFWLVVLSKRKSTKKTRVLLSTRSLKVDKPCGR
jgi:hypothetical protein